MDTQDMDAMDVAKITRAKVNKKYYEANKIKNHRASLLHNVKTRGRVPTLRSVTHYEIDLPELLCKWRVYKSKTENIPANKLKMQVLVANMI